MDERTHSAVINGLVVLDNTITLGGTAYLVGWHGWSPWWFLLAVALMSSVKRKAHK